MKYSLLLLVFLVCIHSSGQISAYVSSGLNYSKVRYGKTGGGHDRMEVFTTAPLFLGIGIFSKPEGILYWNLELNYTRRFISGFSYLGGLGSGTRYEGKAKADILYAGFFTGFEWGKHNKWRIGPGIQIGIPFLTNVKYRTSTWSIANPSTSKLTEGSGKDLFYPYFVKPAIQIGYDFSFGEKYSMGIHYRIANDITRFGDRFTWISAWDNTIVLRWMMKKPFKKSKS